MIESYLKEEKMKNKEMNSWR